MNYIAPIHVTQVGGCARKWWHRIQEPEVKLPNHYYSVKGILTHTVIEKCVRDMECDFNVEYPSLLKDDDRNRDAISEEMYNSAMPEVNKCVEKFAEWSQGTSFNLDEFTPEENIKMKHKGYVLTGTPDLFSSDTLIDFKSGKASKRKEYIQQAGAYTWMLKEAGLASIKNATLVFLGDSKPKEVDISIDIPEGYHSFQDNFDKTIDIIKMCEKGFKPSCEIGFHCVFCGYRGVCNGI